MPSIEQIKANGLCVGCGLCAALSDPAKPAISMVDDSAGYRRPQILRPIPESQARAVDAMCPGLNIVHDPVENEAHYYREWGPVVEARLGWSTDPELRLQASSGGGLSAVLIHLLNTGAIDYVVQTTVSEESPIRNALAISVGRDDVFHAAGSRYAPSSPLQDIASRLDQPGRFAFVGKPCDVVGLRQLARHDRRVAEKVPYMLAFMCAGVPSYHGTNAVLAAMGIEDPQAVVGFRFRGNGWPGFATATLSDGTKRTMDYNTSWGTILNRHLQFRCKICPDGTGEFADITFADGWHCDERGYPLFENSDGRSLILTRTERGESLLREAEAAGTIAFEPTKIENLRHIQPYQANRKGLILSRLAAMRTAGRKVPRFRNLALLSLARKSGLKANLKSYFGTLRRLIPATR